MRLRQVGTTQSVAFFAPPEVHQSILDICQEHEQGKINSSHVIRWLLEQTCQSNEQLQTLHTAQGLEFCRRNNAGWVHSNFLTNKSHRLAFLNSIRSPERLTLEEQYGIKIEHQRDRPSHISCPAIAGITETLLQQREAMVDHTSFGSVMEEVEQEREVEVQVEEVRQVYVPTHYEALKFPGLHSDIFYFATTGGLNEHHTFELALSFLLRTSSGSKASAGIRASAGRLLVSAEFTRTIRRESEIDDNFWVSQAESLSCSALRVCRDLSTTFFGAFRHRALSS